MNLREILGFLGGAGLAPAAAVGSLLRRGRPVHRDGVVYRAEVKSAATGGPAAQVASQLEGPAIVRLSSALWAGPKEKRPDLLGAAVRFQKSSTAGTVPEKDDQDLLFATMRSALLLLPALLTTNVHSFLWDDYYALGVFDAGELGRIKLRLATPRIGSEGMSRQDSLDNAVAKGLAVLELQACELRLGAKFEPVAKIKLLERANVDQAALRFSPFRNGRGIVARGFLNALRILPYAASQMLRPQHED